VDFVQWPLHVTVVPWFRCGMATGELCRGLAQVLEGIDAFDVTMAETANFGRGGRKPVRLVSQPTVLMDIERKVRSYLRDQGAWLADESTRARRSYRPHVTDQADEQLYEGDSFRCDRVSIIEQKGGLKTVMSEVRL
jgi:2'-5' RNA ligase